MNINELSIESALQMMTDGTFTSHELVTACLKNIEEKDSSIGAFLEVWGDEALAQAEIIDTKRAAGGVVGALAGIPIALKDILLVQGKKVTAASKILESYVAPYTATAVQKLLDADAILIGRTNLDEFACGGSTEQSAYQMTYNPLDHTKVAGGSSGGSVAAVAAGMCLCALGSDTGGSVRLPASFCGVVGLKPTYGRVSRYGLIALASSLDQIGPVGKTVDDAMRVLMVIEGQDPNDATSEKIKKTDAISAQPLKGLKIGVPREYFVDGMDEGVKKTVKDAIANFENAGAEIVDIGLPHTENALATYYVIMPCEVASNTARYDGIRYGLSVGDSLDERYLTTRTQGFGAEVKRRIFLGTFALSAGYYDAYYKKAVAVRTAIADDFVKAFSEVDVIMGPTAPMTAFSVGEKVSDPLTMYLADIYTVSANLAGIPAISVPCGTANGMPVGLHIMAPHFEESKLCTIASYVNK